MPRTNGAADRGYGTGCRRRWRSAVNTAGFRKVSGIRAKRTHSAPPVALLPWFDIDMPFWWEVPVMVALGQPDSVDIMHNQFMQYGIDQSEYWGRPRDRKEFPGSQGFVDYCMGLYYRYLNLGYRVPPSAGTGTGVMPGPAGYDRLYAHIDGAFSVEKWYQAIRDGRSFVTNGPMLFVNAKVVNSNPGDARVQIDASAEAREAIDHMELMANGRIVECIRAAGNANRMKARFRIDPRKYSWCAVRCFLKTPDNIRLAHSSPIYLNGKWDAREDAAYFVAWIDELIGQTMAEPKRFLRDHENPSAGEFVRLSFKNQFMPGRSA
jgi:hypothetical protein